MTAKPSPDKPNNPQEESYRPQRPPVVRGTGSTPSERYLATLCDRTFLNLWAYPNVFIDKKAGGKGDGKELCDLLVVCGDHVLIFSDKAISWPDVDNVQLAWKRWYKRAVKKSVDQIRGAERWITNFPDRLFLDRQCSQSLPLALPPPEQCKLHGIVVASGAGKACTQYFDEGIGSLMINPAIEGDDHWKPASVSPFVIGDIDPAGSFVHVLDEATLDIVMQELDTIADFTSYLSKKEMLIRSGKLIVASGEEDLVAYYMTHMNLDNEHDFTKPDGSTLGPDDHIGLQSGFHENLVKNPQYLAKKKADMSSYVWDRLIENFTNHMLEGTTVIPEGQSANLVDLEQGIRHMALVPRYLRRMLGEAILGAIEKGANEDRFTRAVLPGPTEQNLSTGFFFMTLAVPKRQIDGGYEQYRNVRRYILETYALAFLRKNPILKRMVGIATEPPNKGDEIGSSEDLIVVEAPENWTPEIIERLEQSKKEFNITQEGNYTEHPMQGNEFPEVQRHPENTTHKGLNRQQRRARAAQDRRKRQKKHKP